MIVPSIRLQLWAALVLAPAALLAAIAPALAPLAVCVALLFLAVVVLDAVLSPGSLNGIEAVLPPIVRLNKDRPGVIGIQIKNDSQRPRQIRLGLALPGEFSAPQMDLNVLLPAGAAWSLLDWSCTPSRRGNYPLSACYLETASPLGFWLSRKSAPIRSELRVYPDLLKERNAAAAIFLNRGALGVHRHRQTGKARDFEHLREYIAGDSYEDIHWKATAKRSHPVTKIYQIERTQEIYVVIDASRLSARPAPGGSTILERFISAGLILGLAAEQQGDLFGLITFSDRIEKFVRAKNGQSHYNICRDAIYALHPRPVSPDFGELASFIRLRLRRRALLLFLTSLDDPVLAESFSRDIELICRQHVVLVNMMQTPEVSPMFSGPPVETANDLYGRLGGHIQWSSLRELEMKLRRRGVRFSLLEDERLGARLIAQYMDVKQRQVI